MAMKCYPPAADGVDQPSPIAELQLTAACRLHPQRFLAGGHLGGGVPEMRMPCHMNRLINYGLQLFGAIASKSFPVLNTGRTEN